MKFNSSQVISGICLGRLIIFIPSVFLAIPTETACPVFELNEEKRKTQAPEADTYVFFGEAQGIERCAGVPLRFMYALMHLELGCPGKYFQKSGIFSYPSRKLLCIFSFLPSPVPHSSGGYILTYLSHMYCFLHVVPQSVSYSLSVSPWVHFFFSGKS